MKYLIVLCLILSSLSGARLHHESYYQDKWCTVQNGYAEVMLEDRTRVDCLTEKNAIEVDFADKWAECIGQAIHYGLMLNMKPACLIIVEDEERDQKYVDRLKRIGHRYFMDIFIIKP